MKYQTTATPITTEAEFDAARAAGARIEYTACGPGSDFPGDTYDMPPCGQLDSGGWSGLTVRWQPLRAWELMRAFYPATRTEGPEA